MEAGGRVAGTRGVGGGPGSAGTKRLGSAFPDSPQEEALAPADVADTVYARTQPDMTYASGQTFYVKK